ncbi:MAG: DinB family protein [Candidatus Heimdallarchaeota archaeon]
MSLLENAKGSLNYAINMAMNPLDRAISIIPDDKLDWKPMEKTMTASELAIHVYQCALIYVMGTFNGKFSDSDDSMIPFDPKEVRSHKDILEYGKRVKNAIKEILPKLTDEDMEKSVVYECWGGIKIRGFESLSTILEEVIHHRGQLCLYLRMLGIQPPFIYDHTKLD